VRATSALLVAALLLPRLALADDQAPPPVAKQEVGARLGLQLDLGDYGAGGARVGGVWIYQLSEHWWFDSGADAVFGGSGGECFLSRDPGGTRVCDRGAVDGFAFDVTLGVRYAFAAPASGFVPYLHGGLGGGLASLGTDGVSGLRLSFWAGAGLRRRVTDTVAIVGEAQLQLGPALLSDDVGTRAFLEGALVFGVDFAL
jgi:hypothetical protein